MAWRGQELLRRIGGAESYHLCASPVNATWVGRSVATTPAPPGMRLYKAPD